MRELLLLRHGKTKKNAPQSKWERPLKNSGKRNAQRLGAWLQEQGIAPDCVLCSPAAAARETAEKCIKAMGQSVAAISLEPRLETRDPAALLEVVRQYAPGSQRLMLVGHNPALERLIEQLLPADQRPSQQSMPAGTLVHMTLEQSQTSSPNPRAELLARVEPGMLPKTFAVPIQGRIEQRERPAYYYRQSAVIPYRFCAGQLQLLLITASSGRKWGIPKGIHEPGLSAQDSAAREALEEAGRHGPGLSATGRRIFALQMGCQLPGSGVCHGGGSVAVRSRLGGGSSLPPLVHAGRGDRYGEQSTAGGAAEWI